MRAVRFDRYGGPEVLEVRDVDDPVPAEGRVLVRIRAAAVNPGEITIREGDLAGQFPTEFPSGEGSDLAGVVEAVGDGVADFVVGDAVCGWTDERASHAELAAVPVDHLAAKPDALSWEVAGSMKVSPMTGYACLQAVAPGPGETVVVSAAAGGVGFVASQLIRNAGARVIGLAGEHNHGWLRDHGIVPVDYGEGQAGRIRRAAPDGVDAFIDTFGGGYVDLAVELGVPRDRVNTIIDFDAAKRLGVKNEGSSSVARRDVLETMVGLVTDGAVEIPIAASYPLEQVREAYAKIADRHTRGKVVLLP